VALAAFYYLCGLGLLGKICFTSKNVCHGLIRAKYASRYRAKGDFQIQKSEPKAKPQSASC
jgi:hypothetical protein